MCTRSLAGQSFVTNTGRKIVNRPTRATVDYWISAWTNEGKNGKYFGLKFEKKEDKYQTGEGHKPTTPDPADLDDDIPF